MQCKNVRGIKLLMVGLKVLEKILGKMSKDCRCSVCFPARARAVDTIFVRLRQLQEMFLKSCKEQAKQEARKQVVCYSQNTRTFPLLFL